VTPVQDGRAAWLNDAAMTVVTAAGVIGIGGCTTPFLVCVMTMLLAAGQMASNTTAASCMCVHRLTDPFLLPVPLGHSFCPWPLDGVAG
jgi:hypothetical protein